MNDKPKPYEGPAFPPKDAVHVVAMGGGNTVCGRMFEIGMKLTPRTREVSCLDCLCVIQAAYDAAKKKA